MSNEIKTIFIEKIFLHRRIEKEIIENTLNKKEIVELRKIANDLKIYLIPDMTVEGETKYLEKKIINFPNNKIFSKIEEQIGTILNNKLKIHLKSCRFIGNFWPDDIDTLYPNLKENIVEIELEEFGCYYGLTDINEILKLPNLEILKIEGTSKITEFKDIPYTENLKRLELKSRYINKQDERFGEDGLITTSYLLNICETKGRFEFNLGDQLNKFKGLNELLIEKIKIIGNIENENIEKLELIDCENIPSLEKLINLKTLNLSDTGLLIFPEYISKLINLTTLNLSNTKTTNLPDNFGDLINLITLDLSNNELEKLPDSISNLTKIKKLNLINNEKLDLNDMFTRIFPFIMTDITCFLFPLSINPGLWCSYYKLELQPNDINTFFSQTIEYLNGIDETHIIKDVNYNLLNMDLLRLSLIKIFINGEAGIDEGGLYRQYLTNINDEINFSNAFLEKDGQIETSENPEYIKNLLSNLIMLYNSGEGNFSSVFTFGHSIYIYKKLFPDKNIMESVCEMPGKNTTLGNIVKNFAIEILNENITLVTSLNYTSIRLEIYLWLMVEYIENDMYIAEDSDSRIIKEFNNGIGDDYIYKILFPDNSITIGSDTIGSDTIGSDTIGSDNILKIAILNCNESSITKDITFKTTIKQSPNIEESEYNTQNRLENLIPNSIGNNSIGNNSIVNSIPNSIGNNSIGNNSIGNNSIPNSIGNQGNSEENEIEEPFVIINDIPETPPPPIQTRFGRFKNFFTRKRGGIKGGGNENITLLEQEINLLTKEIEKLESTNELLNIPEEDKEEFLETLEMRKHKLEIFRDISLKYIVHDDIIAGFKYFVERHYTINSQFINKKTGKETDEINIFIINNIFNPSIKMNINTLLPLIDFDTNFTSDEKDIFNEILLDFKSNLSDMEVDEINMELRTLFPPTDARTLLGKDTEHGNDTEHGKDTEHGNAAEQAYFATQEEFIKNFLEYWTGSRKISTKRYKVSFSDIKGYGINSHTCIYQIMLRHFESKKDLLLMIFKTLLMNNSGFGLAGKRHLCKYRKQHMKSKRPIKKSKRPIKKSKRPIKKSNTG